MKKLMFSKILSILLALIVVALSVSGALACTNNNDDTGVVLDPINIATLITPQTFGDLSSISNGSFLSDLMNNDQLGMANNSSVTLAISSADIPTNISAVIPSDSSISNGSFLSDLMNNDQLGMANNNNVAPTISSAVIPANGGAVTLGNGSVKTKKNLLNSNPSGSKAKAKTSSSKTNPSSSKAKAKSSSSKLKQSSKSTQKSLCKNEKTNK
jgi:hypothetical protein